MKRVLLILVVMVLVGAGVYWYFGRGRVEAAAFKTATVKRGDLVTTISATGTIEPEELIDIGAQVAGRIITFGKDANGKSVDYGSPVDEGMLLAQIDRSLYDADLQQANAQMAEAEATVKRAEADLLQAKAKLYQAERDWRRAETLGPSDALAQVTYDQYKSTYEAAQANVGVADASILQAKASVDQAQGSIDRANRNIGYTTIKSPVKGVIIDRRVNIGQTVVASLNTPSLFLIAQDLRRMQVWVAVNEADVGRIHAGQPVTFTVDTFPGDVFRGQVNKVRLNAAMTQNVVTYTVEVTTDNSDGRLLPYLTASVQFEVDRHDDVLTVPNAALRYIPKAEQVAPDARAAFEAESNGSGGTGTGSAAGGMGGGGRRRASSAPAETQGTASAASAQTPATGPTSRPSRRRRSGAGEEIRPGTLWTKDGEYVRPVKVMAASTDGAETEVRGPDVKDGMEIVIGEIIPDRSPTASAGGTNPFAPAPMRGRGGPRGGGGGGASGGARQAR